MQSNFLEFFISLYSRKKPAEEFINSSESITNELEKNFKVVDKGFMISVFDRYFPVYAL